MLNNVTVDSVLMKYYHSIDSRHLQDDKINIDSKKVVDSSTKYIQYFAAFLDTLHSKGYVLSDSILKKLMDIIDYEGYEYQIMKCYADIIFKYIDKDAVFEFDGYIDKETSIEYITNYSKAIKNLDSSVESVSYGCVPYFTDIDFDIESPFYVLKEMNAIIPTLYYDITNHKVEDIEQAIETLYVIYKEDPELFSQIDRTRYKVALFFLLLEDSYDALDMFIDANINLFDLHDIIHSCFIYKTTHDINDFRKIFTKNINRVINILTVNIRDEDIAMIISEHFEFWDDLCKSYKIDRFEHPLEMCRTDIKKYKILNDLDFLDKAIEEYQYDLYFYARYILMNMDYRVFCDNFIHIFDKLGDYLSDKEIKEIIHGCMNGLSNLHVEEVDNKLNELHDNLKDTKYSID